MSFVDRAEHRVEQNLALTFDCPDVNESLCGGECANLATAASHCGVCREAVPPDHICEAGEPVCSDVELESCEDGCFTLREFDHCGACTNDCSRMVAENDIPVATYAYITTQYGTAGPRICQDEDCYVVALNNGDRLTGCGAFCESFGLSCVQAVARAPGTVGWAIYTGNFNRDLTSCDEITPTDYGEAAWEETYCGCQQTEL